MKKLPSRDDADSYYLKLRRTIGHGLLVYPVAAACIKDKTGDVLLVKKRQSGLWGFPGGGIEPDETILQALYREIKEEINLDIRLPKLTGIYSGPKFDFAYPNGDNVHPIIFFFDCEILNHQKFSPSQEIEAARYFSLHNLPAMLPCCVQKAKDCQLRRKDVIIR